MNDSKLEFLSCYEKNFEIWPFRGHNGVVKDVGGRISSCLRALANHFLFKATKEWWPKRALKT